MTVEVTEVLQTVQVSAPDQIVVQEVVDQVIVGGADHPAEPARTLYVATATATVVNTTTETTLIGSGVGSLTIPANALKVGSQLIVQASGLISLPAGALLSILLKFNGTTFAQSTAITPSPAAVGRNWRVLMPMTVRGVGAPGIIIGRTWFEWLSLSGAIGAPRWAEMFTAGGGTSPVDTTVANVFDFTADWAVASPSSSIDCSEFVLTLDPPPL